MLVGGKLLVAVYQNLLVLDKLLLVSLELFNQSILVLELGSDSLHLLDLKLYFIDLTVLIEDGAAKISELLLKLTYDIILLSQLLVQLAILLLKQLVEPIELGLHLLVHLLALRYLLSHTEKLLVIGLV